MFDVILESLATCVFIHGFYLLLHAMYIASYGSFLNWGYVHDAYDIIMDLIIGLKNLKGYAVGY